MAPQQLTSLDVAMMFVFYRATTVGAPVMWSVGPNAQVNEDIIPIFSARRFDGLRFKREVLARQTC